MSNNPWRPAALALAAAAILIGCAQPSPFQRWTDLEPKPRASAPTTQPATQPHQSRIDVFDSDHATVDDYVRAVTARNLELRRARHAVEAALARVPQVQSLDDPVLTVAPVGEMAQTAAGEVAAMTGIRQTLPTPGKLEARGDAALAEARAAKARWLGVRHRVTAEARRAYWGYYQVTRAMEVIERSKALLRRFERAAAAAYAAGDVPQQDVLRAQIEREELSQKLLELRQRREAHTARLNALMDRAADAPLPEPTDVTLRAVEPALEALLAQAERHNPALSALRRQIDAERHRLRLAKLARWPNLTAGVNYNIVDDEGLASAPTGDDQWWLSLGVNLPIWTRKYDAAEREARKRIQMRLAALRSARNGLSATLRETLAELRTQQQLVDLFESELTPRSRQALDASLAAYRAGDSDFADIIDHWRKLLRYRRLYHTAVADLAAAHARLEQTVGRDLSPRPVAPVRAATQPDPANTGDNTPEESNP